MIDRVALFVTCLADTLFPQVGQATVTVLERLGIEVVFPLEQTCCGQMHANSGYPGEADLLARRFVEIFDGFDAIVTPSGSCAAQVREHVPGLLGGDDRGVPARTWELSQFLTGVLGVEDVGSTYEGTVAYHPTCHSLRLLRVGDAPLRLLRAVPGVELVELPDAEECCGFGGTFAVKNADVSAAMLDEKLAAVVAQRRRSGLRVRQLVPDAHRRRPSPPRRRRAAGAPGGDPRLVSGCGAGTRGPRASRMRRPRRSRIARSGRTSATPPARSAPSAPRSSPRCPTGRRCARPRRRSRMRRSPGSTRCSSSWRRRSQAAGGVVHWARDAAEANEIVVALVRAEGADEVVKVKSLATDEIRLNEALEAAGIRPIETDLAELIIQLADERPSHLLVPAIHKNRVEIRDLFRARLGPPGPLRRSRRAGRGGPAPPARGVPARAGRDLGRELRRRRHRHDLRRRVRGQRADVHDAARGADHRDGDREGDPALPRPRGVPAAAAPLVDRRADEPLHLAVDGRARG